MSKEWPLEGYFECGGAGRGVGMTTDCLGREFTSRTANYDLIIGLPQLAMGKRGGTLRPPQWTYGPGDEDARPARRGRGSRHVAAARTPPRRTPGTSRSCAHRNTYRTAGARRVSRQAGSDDQADRTAAAASSMSHRCSGPARRLRA
jgi:hypothetical protein